jgi:hypothetical protein
MPSSPPLTPPSFSPTMAWTSRSASLVQSNVAPNWYLQADKLTTLIKAAGVDEVEPIWATLFAKVLTVGGD